MKTAEEWVSQQQPANIPTRFIVADVAMIKQIQLDAYKQGLTDAADLASKKAVSYDNAGCELASQAILAKRNNTTSLP